MIALGAAALGARNEALAQAPRGSARVCWASSSDSFKEPWTLAFVQRLAELGYVEGRNLVLERRHANNRIEDMPKMSAQIARLNCDVYFGGGTEANLAALAQADRRTPIVFVAVDFDPIATGDVASLARPGGRVTGITALQSTLPAKRLELMREMLPNVDRIAVFTNDQTSAQLALVQGTARRLGLELHVVDFKRPPFDYESGFADAVRAKAGALFVLGSGLWVPGRRKIVDLSLRSRLPSVFHHAFWVESGGLMSYGFDFPWMWRRGADMVVSVLNGGKPAEMPMEQPTEFELAFNLKTARALGLKIPQSLLVRANRVIE
jgi:putative ABC transport system substrate-binding protein